MYYFTFLLVTDSCAMCDNFFGVIFFFFFFFGKIWTKVKKKGYM